MDLVDVGFHQIWITITPFSTQSLFELASRFIIFGPLLPVFVPKVSC